MSTTVRHRFRYLIAEVPSIGDVVALGPDDAHHLTRVARRRSGDLVELIDPSGARWPGQVAATDPASVVVTGPAVVAGSEDVRGTLWLGLCKADAAETVVRMVTELGLARIVFVRTERIGRVPGLEELERRAARLARIAEVAQRQCGRGAPLQIDGTVELGAALAQADTERAVMLDPRADLGLPDFLASGAIEHLFVGPEAGFADHERAAAAEAGVRSARLGPRILRVETACVAAVTTILRECS